jgi:hypothetical protein
MSEFRYPECRYAECRISFIYILNANKPSVVMLNVDTLSVVAQ